MTHHRDGEIDADKVAVSPNDGRANAGSCSATCSKYFKPLEGVISANKDSRKEFHQGGWRLHFYEVSK